jgi:hypothetical protein
MGIERFHGCQHRLLRPTSHDPPGRSSRLAAANSAALRQHFGELTSAFLAPFAAFWQPTPPPPGTVPVPVQGPPHLPPFSHTDFLDSLPRTNFPPILLERFANQVWLLKSCAFLAGHKQHSQILRTSGIWRDLPFTLLPSSFPDSLSPAYS